MTLGSTCALNAASSFPLPPHSSCKERDTESGNDDFGARYYNSATGRFRSPDWSDGPAAVPYAKFGDPQSLNLYSYVYNNPLGGIDPDGHDSIEGLDLGVNITFIGDHGYYNQMNAAETTAEAAQQQSQSEDQQGQWSTTPPTSGHYLTNAYFPEGADGAGHWGVGLDTPDKTVGFATNDGVPKFLRAILLAIGAPLPGAIHDDSMVNQTGVQRFYRPLTDAQFDAAQSAMNNRASHSGLYSLYFRNCALWDQSVDHAAGVSGVPHIVAFPMVLRLWYPQQ